MKPIRFGILGAGGIAHLMHFPELQALGRNVEVVCIQGRKQTRLRLLCRKFGVRHWTHDPDHILGDPRIDALIVATPHPLHVGLGIRALKARKHLCMQKPLCGDMGEAHAFVRAVERSDRIVMVLPHFGAATVAMLAQVNKGAIGKVSGAYARASHGGPEVYYAEVRDSFHEKSRGLWFFDTKQASVGALFDMGVYAVAQLVALLGTVRRVTGITRTMDKPTKLEDTATLLLEFKSGVVATAETGWCDPAQFRQVRVHGTRGMLVMPGERGAQLTHWIPGSYTREDVPSKSRPVPVKAYDRGSAHAHFIECIRKRRQPPLSHAYAARHVTEILLAGLRSGKVGKPIAVKSEAEK